MRSHNWSTGLVERSDRFGYWNEVICDAVLNVEARRTAPGDFRAELTCNRTAIGRFVRFHAEAHDIVRTGRLLSTKPDESYLVSLQLSGLCHVTQGDSRFTLRPGDIGIISAARPMHQTFEHAVRRAVAVLPRHALEGACGWISPSRPLRLERGRPMTRVLSRLMGELTVPDAEFTAAEEDALTRTFLDILAASGGAGFVETRHIGAGHDGSARGGQAGAMRPDPARSRLVAHLAANIADPDLSPGSAAAALGMSERTVHAAFAGSGTTFRRWIIDERLTRAAQALRSPDWAGTSVSEVAFRLGFSDLSHFSRRFKARFGCSPRAYRDAS